jgi:hypothetical protein
LDKHRLLVAVATVTGFGQIYVTDNSYNILVFEKFMFRNGITDLPVRFLRELDKVSYSKPSIDVTFDVPPFQRERVNPMLVPIAACVVHLVWDISAAWRATGRI